MTLLAITSNFSAQTAFAQDLGPAGVNEAARGVMPQPALKQAPAPQMRSAQGDCVREANRRGYAVTDTGNYQQSRDGWSIDMRARDRRGHTTEGTCFVYTGTREVSLYGFGWGDDWNGNDTLEFICASTESRYRECQLPVNGRARIVKRLSDSRCVEGNSWGQMRDRVWVDHGCRARFEVTRDGHGGGNGGGNGGLIQCLSENKRYRECSLGSGYSGARLVRELSSKDRCQRDSTWGTRGDILWVTNGCRGEFERIRGFGSGGSGSGGSQNAGITFARSACLSEVRRLNLGLEQQNEPRAVPGGYRMELQVRTGSGARRNATCTFATGTTRARIDVQH